MKIINMFRAVAIGTALVSSTCAYASSNFEKVDIVKEGIDQKQAVVRANSGGYTSYENDTHTYYVRVFAKAKGANAVYAAAIGSNSEMSLSEVTSGTNFFIQKTQGDGWGVYARSIVFSSKLSQMPWYVSPKKACMDNLNKQVANGIKKENVLKKDWKLSASASIFFYAGADSKVHIRNGKTGGTGETRMDSIAYTVNVLCRAAL